MLRNAPVLTMRLPASFRKEKFACELCCAGGAVGPKRGDSDSDSHADFFIKNMLALLVEERVALLVKRPEAFVTGHYTVGT
jgi:hypothetical protein